MALIDRIAKAYTPAEVIPISAGIIEDLPKPKPFAEIGSTGLLRTRGIGYVYEEWLNDLSVYKQKQIYREMRDNDAIIGSMFFALETILRRAVWKVEAADNSGAKGEEYAKFLKECMEDMSHSWEDFVAEVVSQFVFGYAIFETVYKRREGPEGKKASRYDDGLIGWRKMAPRAQESILYWVWDDEGGLQGVVQLAAPDYRTIPIPIEKLLVFRTTSLKNNPEGRSILRNCYRSWFFKRRLEEVEAIGVERDLCGIPVLYASAAAVEAIGGEDVARKIVRNIRVDDQMGVVLPLAYDDKGNPEIDLKLLQSGGSKQTNAGEVIKRYNQDMLNTILAGFIQFGQTPTGSRSLHLSATSIFTEAIAAFMDSVAAVINRIAIPRLLSLNKMDLDKAPRLVPGKIGNRDLAELSSFVQALSQAGLTFIDRDTENYLREAADLPLAPDDKPEPPDGGAPQAPPSPQTKPPTAQASKPTPPQPERKKPALTSAAKPKAPPKKTREEAAEDLRNAT